MHLGAGAAGRRRMAGSVTCHRRSIVIRSVGWSVDWTDQTGPPTDAGRRRRRPVVGRSIGIVMRRTNSL